MSLHTKIRELRLRDRLSQEELAQRVGVRRETIGHLENGHYNPSLKLAMDIAHVFGCTVEDIFSFEADPIGPLPPPETPAKNFSSFFQKGLALF